MVNAGSMASTWTSGARSGPRTPVACELCRKKKAKCDGERPVCSNCHFASATCVYNAARPPRRKKHWDADYVRSLEDQVRLHAPSGHPPAPTNSDHSHGSAHTSGPTTTPCDLPYSEVGLKALTEFASLNWALNKETGGMGNIFTGPGSFSVLAHRELPMFEQAEETLVPSTLSEQNIATFIAEIRNNTPLKQQLKARFLDCINPYYNFVDPSWLQFSDMFPDNDIALQLLYSAMFAAAAYSMPSVSTNTARAFVSYAESHIQQCYMEHLALPTFQALIILAWLKHSMLDSRKGDLYKYMAIGLSTHLGMPDNHGGQSAPQDVSTVGTFWCLYLIDSVATARLGCNSSIPWDLDEIPSYTSMIPDHLTDISNLAFEYHCRLARLQKQYIEPLYSTRSRSRSTAEKQRIHNEASRVLVKFRGEIDERLYLTRRKVPHKAQIIFWVVYHSVIINMHRPILDPSDEGMSHYIEPSLRAVTAAAESIIQLAVQLRKRDELSSAPPCMAIHLLRASLVHLLGVTVYEGNASKKAEAGFWECMSAMGEVGQAWKTLTTYFMRFLVGKAKNWGVDSEGSFKPVDMGHSPVLEALMPSADEIQ